MKKMMKNNNKPMAKMNDNVMTNDNDNGNDSNNNDNEKLMKEMMTIM